MKVVFAAGLNLGYPFYCLYCTFSITSASCFPKEYYSNRGISPACIAFNASRLILKANVSPAALTGQTKAGTGCLCSSLYCMRIQSPAENGRVDGSPQTCPFHFWGFSSSFFLGFPGLPFLSFTWYSPSIFHSRTTCLSSRKHPPINYLSYKLLIY